MFGLKFMTPAEAAGEKQAAGQMDQLKSRLKTLDEASDVMIRVQGDATDRLNKAHLNMVGRLAKALSAKEPQNRSY